MLRARRRELVRADAEEDEAVAATAHLRGRDLEAVARDAVHRGDVLAVRCGLRTWAGTAIDAGAGWLCLRTATGVVDIHLPAVAAITVTAVITEGGGPLGQGARSWTARMAERELTGESVEVGLVDGEAHTGRLVAAATDHLLVETSRGRSAIARSATAWVRSAAE